MQDYSLTADNYAYDVISGQVLASKYVKLAAQRHLDDKKAQENGDHPFIYNGEKAVRACIFIEAQYHTKGRWAKGKQNLILEPWQIFFICNIFGWMKAATGLRRYIEILLLVPRKNGKSALAAAIGLYMLCADNEHGAEVYTGATSEKQAKEVFTPAQAMARMNPAMTSHFGIEVNASNICVPENGSKMEPIIGNPPDGTSPSCAIIDEVHEMKDSRLIDTMITGMGAREQPIMLYITTAGDNLSGPCYQLQLEAQKCLEGVMVNDGLFSLIYGIDSAHTIDIINPLDMIGTIERCLIKHAKTASLYMIMLEVFAANVIKKRDITKEHLHLEFAKIIQIDTSSAKDFVRDATRLVESIAAKRSEKNGTSTHLSGLKKTELADQQQCESGKTQTKGKPRKSKQTQSSTGYQCLNTSLSLMELEENATHAERKLKLYALITAIVQSGSGVCYVKNATLGSVFLEIVNQVFLQHSSILGGMTFDGERISQEIPADDWSELDTLKKANPNYGVSVSDDFLQARLQDAKNNARKQSTFLTKHLNVWVGSRDAFFNVDKWRQCSGDIKLSDYFGQPIYIGMDLASRVDIAAIEILIPVGDDYVRFGKYYLPESAVENGNEMYTAWMREGWMTVTDGEIIDFNIIKEDILELCSQFEVRELAYDPFQATMLITELMSEGVPVVEMRPTVLNFSEPMKSLDALIRAKKIKHNGDPVAEWMISNVVAKEDAKENVYPRKERAENKIDMTIALLMALGRCQHEQDTAIDFDNFLILDLNPGNDDDHRR